MIKPVIVQLPLGDEKATLYYGQDVIEVAKGLKDQSVHMIATSPPYWGLRDYGTGTWEGGDPDCEHKMGGQVQDSKAEGAITAGANPGCDASKCKKCGAKRVDDQIGLERTPEEFIAKLVEVFRELKRVLRDDGTLWVNIGDSYCSLRTHNDGGVPTNTVHVGGKREGSESHYRPNRAEKYGLKNKDLVGIPWMCAFALRADGWYLRRDIIWQKLNPMPESVIDRCTSAHEYIFMLSKRPYYFFDQVAIQEPSVTQDPRRPYTSQGAWKMDGRPLEQRKSGQPRDQNCDVTLRNRRSVWPVSTQSYKGSHYAVWPEKLVEPMILAGTSRKGCCPACGAPWKRVVEKTKPPDLGRGTQGWSDGGHQPGNTRQRNGHGGLHPQPPKELGWEPTCSCPENKDPIPCTVLDPFSGSATTGRVALLNGRDYIGIDLGIKFLEMAKCRILGQEAPDPTIEKVSLDWMTDETE